MRSKPDLPKIISRKSKFRQIKTLLRDYRTERILEAAPPHLPLKTTQSHLRFWLRLCREYQLMEIQLVFFKI